MKDSTRELWLAATIEANGWGRVADVEMNRMGQATFFIELTDNDISETGFDDLETRYWEGRVYVVPTALQSRVKELQTKIKNLKAIRQR